MNFRIKVFLTTDCLHGSVLPWLIDKFKGFLFPLSGNVDLAGVEGKQNATC